MLDHLSWISSQLHQPVSNFADSQVPWGVHDNYVVNLPVSVENKFDFLGPCITKSARNSELAMHEEADLVDLKK